MAMASVLPGPAIRGLTGLREGLMWALEPIDFAARLVNGKRHLPPLRIRRRAGPLAGLERSGAEFLAYLQLLCGLSSESRLLDIGCGFGLLGLQLEDRLRPPGRYVGIDIDGRAIRWARQHVGARDRPFEFIHLDIQNPHYNGKGRLKAESVTFPFESESFDIIVLKSVFTHLRPDASRNYLSEVRRMLTPSGICLATFFILRDVGDRAGEPSLDFRFGDGGWRYAVREMPELAIAYDESRLREMITQAGLQVRGEYRGTWSGAKDGLSYQDIVTISRT